MERLPVPSRRVLFYSAVFFALLGLVFYSYYGLVIRDEDNQVMPNVIRKFQLCGSLADLQTFFADLFTDLLLGKDDGSVKLRQQMFSAIKDWEVWGKLKTFFTSQAILRKCEEMKTTGISIADDLVNVTNNLTAMFEESEESQALDYLKHFLDLLTVQKEHELEITKIWAKKQSWQEKNAEIERAFQKYSVDFSKRMEVLANSWGVMFALPGVGTQVDDFMIRSRDKIRAVTRENIHASFEYICSGILGPILYYLIVTIIVIEYGNYFEVTFLGSPSIVFILSVFLRNSISTKLLDPCMGVIFILVGNFFILLYKWLYYVLVCLVFFVIRHIEERERNRIHHALTRDETDENSVNTDAENTVNNDAQH